MDIERMHEMIEKLSECAKCEFDKGVENIDTCEMKEAIDMLKDLSEAMYYRTLTVAMQESDTDEIMDMFDRYGEDRRFYDNYRYKTSGRFAPKGKGSYMPRRGYEEPPYYHMTPEMYREHDPEWYRDMDKHTRGVMYYTEPLERGEKVGERKDNLYESRYDRAKRMYTETKDTHKAGTAEDKQAKMKSLEAYTKELAEDVTEMITDMSAEEKNLLRTKMQTLAQKIQ